MTSPAPPPAAIKLVSASRQLEDSRLVHGAQSLKRFIELVSAPFAGRGPKKAWQQKVARKFSDVIVVDGQGRKFTRATLSEGYDGVIKIILSTD